MKKIILLIVLVVAPLVSKAQSVFDKFEDMDDVTTVVVNKRMFELFVHIDSDDPDAKRLMDMVKSLQGLKLFTTENEKIAKDMSATVSKYIKTGKLEELMRVKDKDANIKFYIKEGKDKDHVKELLMYIEGISDVHIKGREVESVLLSIVGDIDLNQIGELTKAMNLPSELNNVQNK
ncbi:hypothetical protein NBRC110019_07100 [Neptunitalea chrysea]|uniref:DUF4252 domain-containing protein n=1 Tax=Neptunitalea chrysea TaxID=1647581 RepID=A0A9W6B3C7_9FLAO|nr:DUF4252 domain-containing protein [Neptunitalea chrysea]GLB51671.1 hypothetical protein NBRC110019_07100 [Neptunitalea chrysea]